MPFTDMPEGRLRRAVVPLLVLYAAAFVPFALVGDPAELTRLQFARSVARAEAIVSGWSASETTDLAFLQGFDFVHPLVYGVLLSIGAVWAGRRLGRGTTVMSWVAPVGAVSDVVENIGMIAMIRGAIEAPIPTVTTIAAASKYLLLVAALLYVAAGLLARRRRV